jgi:hypothetical protein
MYNAFEFVIELMAVLFVLAGLATPGWLCAMLSYETHQSRARSVLVFVLTTATVVGMFYFGDRPSCDLYPNNWSCE